MKKMRRLLSLLLVVVMLFTLTACGGGKTSDDADTGTDTGADDGEILGADIPEDTSAAIGDEKITVRIGVTGYLGRFLSGLAPQESHSACNAVFDSIFRIDPFTKERKSDVLEEWYWEDDNHFVMKLIDGVYFADGTKATSEDLLYSYQHHEERGSSYLSGTYIELDKCEIVDELTVRMYVSQKSVGIMSTFHLYSKAWSEAHPWDSEDWYYPMASGAYEVTEYVVDDYMVLTLRDDYWKHSYDEYYVKEYYYKYYPDASTLYMELELGNIDLCAIQSTDYTRYKSEDNSDKNYNVLLDPTGGTYYMNFGFKDNEIWYNKDLRLALAHGIDWESVGILVCGDLYTGNNGFAPLTSPSYYDAGTREYNPELAKEYLAKAGYEPGELKLKCCMMDTAAYKNFGQAITYYLTEMGIEIEIQYADVSASIANWLEVGNNDINLMFAAGGAAEENVRGSLNQVHLWPGVSWAYVDDAHFQELYAKLLDPSATQDELYAVEKEIQQYIYDECLICPFAEYNGAFGYNSDMFPPELIQAITFSNRYQLTELGLKENWERYQ